MESTEEGTQGTEEEAHTTKVVLTEDTDEDHEVVMEDASSIPNFYFEVYPSIYYFI